MLMRFLDNNYNVNKVSKMNPWKLSALEENIGQKVSGIRQQTKFFQIVMFSRLIQRDNTILELLTNPPIQKL